MESLGDILRRNPPPGSSSADTDASSEVSSPSQREGCPRCGGSGWLRRDVPYGHPDFGKLHPCSCLEQELEEERQARLRRYSHLGPLTRLTFTSFKSEGRSRDPLLQERSRRAYQAALTFAREPRGWLVLTGASGTGKTHLAAAIVNYLLEQGRPAIFMVVPDLLDHLRSTFAPSTEVAYDQLFSMVCQAPLLALDGLSSAGSTPWAREKLFQLLNHRYNAQLPTVITLIDLEELDERWVTRLTDPEMSQVLHLGGEASLSIQRMSSLDLPLHRGQTFDSFDPRGVCHTREEQESLRMAYQAAQAFARKPDGWLVLIGTNGCGKTHLAAAIANYRLAQGNAPIFVKVPELLDHLRFTFRPDSTVSYDKVFDQVRMCPLLILDDFGAHSPTPWALEKLYQIVDYRYSARLPTVFTAPVSDVDELGVRFSSRLMDRMLSLVIPIKAPDYRIDHPQEPRPAPGQSQWRRRPRTA